MRRPAEFCELVVSGIYFGICAVHIGVGVEADPYYLHNTLNGLLAILALLFIRTIDDEGMRMA